MMPWSSRSGLLKVIEYTEMLVVIKFIMWILTAALKDMMLSAQPPQLQRTVHKLRSWHLQVVCKGGQVFAILYPIACPSQ